MAMPNTRPSRKSKDAAIAGLHNLTRRKPAAAAADDVEPDETLAPPMDNQPAESDSDFELPAAEPKSVPRTGRRPRGGGAGEGSVSRRGRRGGGAGRGDASTRKKARTDTGDGEGSLFEIVKSGKTALNTVVDEWIEAYKQDRDAALLELIQFFIHCSGCRGRITPHMYHNMEHADIIRKMTEEFDEDSGDYPLIMTGPAYKKFKSNFCEFIQTLVHQCQYSIIYDQYMMDNVISLLTGLTDSQVRAFRHTSTLASMKLMTALVDVALNVSVTLDHTQRQYDAERSKAKGKQASDRLENLIEKRKEAEENQEEIRHMLTYIFKGVFVHRYRDSQAEIRAICTAEIGVWMKNYPGMFLDDSYLKYIGWTLYDRIGEVRLCCLRCLQPLYDSEELAPKLELFTNRFKERIVEMTLDKEYDVSVQAVKLVISILRCNPTVLTDKDCENVYELVYSSHRGVAQAAGEFLNAKLFAHELDESTENLRTKKGKKRSENTSRIRDLVLFFIESELHEHGSYLVDSLWDINEMLKDWECMTDLLLEEPGAGEEALDDRQESSLIEIMVCCVKQAATGDYPIGRGPTTRRPTTKEAKVVADDKSKLTEHFIVTLPQLLVKYTMDEEKVTSLLQIPLYFDLEIYVTSRQEKNLDLLMRHIANIVEKHSDSEVLENCSKVLEYFVSDNTSIKSRCLTARDTLVDQLVDRYRQAMTSFFEEGDEPDEDDTFALLTSLKRLHAFWSCHDLNPWMLWESHSHFLSCTTIAVPDEILCKAISCCHLSIIWQLDALDRKNPSKEAMKALQSCLNRFMNACTDMLDKYSDVRQEEAYLCLCDMLIIFGHSVTQDSPQLECLVYDATKELQRKLTRFLNEKVFIEDDDDGMDENKKIEELHKRRNFLASFCKLIVYNIIRIKCATDMFKYYMKFYNDYGDIIKATLSKAREINKVHTAKTLALSLTQLYRELQEEQPVVDRSSDSFRSIKELARRFSLSFGLDQVKNREAVAAMHKEGIQFVVSTASFPFLEILSEFSGKLMKQDKKVVLSYLDSCLRSPPEQRTEDHTLLSTYRHGLLMGEGDSTVAAPTTGPKRGRGAKRKLNVEAEETTVQFGRGRGGGAGSAGGQTPAHHPAQPPITLSVSKRPHIDAESASEADVEAPSERDYESSSLPATQHSWLKGQKRQRKESTVTNATYSLRQRNDSKPHVDESISDLEERDSERIDTSSSRSRSESPPAVTRVVQLMPGMVLDSNKIEQVADSQNDGSEEMSFKAKATPSKNSKCSEPIVMDDVEPDGSVAEDDNMDYLDDDFHDGKVVEVVEAEVQQVELGNGKQRQVGKKKLKAEESRLSLKKSVRKSKQGSRVENEPVKNVVEKSESEVAEKIYKKAGNARGKNIFRLDRDENASDWDPEFTPVKPPTVVEKSKLKRAEAEFSGFGKVFDLDRDICFGSSDVRIDQQSSGKSSQGSKEDAKKKPDPVAASAHGNSNKTGTPAPVIASPWNGEADSSSRIDDDDNCRNASDLEVFVNLDEASRVSSDVQSPVRPSVLPGNFWEPSPRAPSSRGAVTASETGGDLDDDDSFLDLDQE